jgi:hypothetical protein
VTEQPKMNPEVKDLWVKALRSGEYSQAEGKLCYASKEDGSRSFCCLGVLADLGVKAGVIPDWVGDTPEASTLGIRLGGTANYSDLNGLIPLLEWAGLSAGNPVVGRELDPDGDEYNSIEAIHANDEREWTFDQIADGIEAYL